MNKLDKQSVYEETELTHKEQEKLVGGTGGNRVGGQLPGTWMFSLAICGWTMGYRLLGQKVRLERPGGEDVCKEIRISLCTKGICFKFLGQS